MAKPEPTIRSFPEGARWRADILAWRRRSCAQGLIDETSDGEVAWLVFLTQPAPDGAPWSAAWGALDPPLRMAVYRTVVSLFPKRVRRYPLTQQRVDALVEAGADFDVMAENLTRLVPGEGGLGARELARARAACARRDRSALDDAMATLRAVAPYDSNHRD
jgi:hypothetical protein